MKFCFIQGCQIRFNSEIRLRFRCTVDYVLLLIDLGSIIHFFIVNDFQLSVILQIFFRVKHVETHSYLAEQHALHVGGHGFKTKLGKKITVLIATKYWQLCPLQKGEDNSSHCRIKLSVNNNLVKMKVLLEVLRRAECANWPLPLILKMVLVIPCRHS